MVVTCVRTNDIGFTPSKAYNIEDGRIIDDQGTPRPLFISKNDPGIRTVADIRDRKDGNWSWIGEFY